MADKTSYPQIPSTVWWGVRALFHRNPSAKVDEHFLSADLKVQEAAARQYVAELRKAGLITEEGRATQLAAKWRLDDTYAKAVAEIMSATYPEGLRQLGEPGKVDRQKVISWFMSHGLGAGAANNKASTYLLIGAPTPNEAPSKNGDAEPNNRPKRERPRSSKGSQTARSAPAESERPAVVTREPPSSELPALNVNVQIHISADATGDQIEKIFSAMKRYLYEGA